MCMFERINLVTLQDVRVFYCLLFITFLNAHSIASPQFFVPYIKYWDVILPAILYLFIIIFYLYFAVNL